MAASISAKSVPRRTSKPMSMQMLKLVKLMKNNELKGLIESWPARNTSGLPEGNGLMQRLLGAMPRRIRKKLKRTGWSAMQSEMVNCIGNLARFAEQRQRPIMRTILNRWMFAGFALNITAPATKEK